MPYVTRNEYANEKVLLLIVSTTQVQSNQSHLKRELAAGFLDTLDP